MIQIMKVTSVHGICADLITILPWPLLMHTSFLVQVLLHTKLSCLLNLDILSNTLDSWGVAHKYIEFKKNMNHSTYANSHPKNSNYAKINKLIITYDDDIDDNDKTVMHSNCTRDVCKRLMNKEIHAPMDHRIFNSGMTGHSVIPKAPMINKHPASNPLCIDVPREKGISILKNLKFNLLCYIYRRTCASASPDVLTASGHHLSSVCVKTARWIGRSKHLEEPRTWGFSWMKYGDSCNLIHGHHTPSHYNWSFGCTRGSL